MGFKTVNIDAKELKRELIEFKRVGRASERLGEMFIEMSQGMSNRRNFINYTYKDEMISQAILYLIKYSKNFNPDYKNSNAFAYCSQIIFNAFRQIIIKFKKDSDLKQKIITRAIETGESVYGKDTDSGGHAFWYEGRE